MKMEVKPKLKKSVQLEEKSSYITRSSELGLMLVDYNTSKIYEANETASIIATLCDGEHTIDDIVDAIYEKYDAPRDVIEADVRETLKRMSDFKVIKM
ncbi:MAG TPA: PqqD family protein [Candidatus Syntrophoarchaeum butanivorans]|uniref:PqqD family protein n=1 Tax=Candidatus Syntropharchaeum butanivorans TaxID=1839936 RepID=A0A7C0X2B2_9EURY|nr:MAG: PqqD family protein [Candidatus Syntrophoarchaeum sp. WYZ-LMO15]HDM36534.1 PqqD family protein [Candidatus Syntrophoarchaeum butanivorans]HEC56912.1 PqqD family protein [Candidatus Syntrophoarchaeum butanivorans]